MKQEVRRTIHAAFGTISANRTHHHPEHLFGSDIEHMNTVRLEVCEAERIVDIDLNHEQIHSRKSIITIALTEQQFASLITTMNVGGGTPCTIQRRSGVSVDPPPPPVKPAQACRQTLTEKGKKMAEELLSIERDLGALIDGDKPPGKTALRELLKRLHYAQCPLTDGMPFLYEQYHEALENAARDAETALHGRVISLFQKLGLDAAKATPIPRLSSPERGEE